MELEQSTEVQCPYCGENFLTFVDLSAGDSEYIEDCQVCCRPIQLFVTIENLEDGQFSVRAELTT